MSLLLYIGLFFLCLILYRPGIKCFLLWVFACVILAIVFTPYAVIWPALFYLFLWSHDACPDYGSNSCGDSESRSEPSSSRAQPSGRSRSGYRYGNTTHYSGGTTSVRSGNVTYFSNGVRSVRSGAVTYYFDSNGHELGRSVNTGNGVHIYFDINNKEIGRSYTSGCITDFIGDSFEF